MGASAYMVMAFIAGSAASADFEVPTPEALAFQRSSVTVGNRNRAIEYIDMESGAKTRFWYEVDRDEQVVESYDESGKLVLRETSAPRGFTVETFKDGKLVSRERLTPDPSVGLGYLLEKDGKREQVSPDAFFSGSGDRCWKPDPIATNELDKLLKGGLLVKLKPNLSIWGLTNLGSNALARDCDGYPPGKPKGDDNLAKEASTALDRGLRCLANIGKKFKGPETGRIRGEVARLLAYFDPDNFWHPFTYMCDYPGDKGAAKPLIDDLTIKLAGGSLNAIAAPCADPKNSRIAAPGMILNVSNLRKKTPLERQATLFHEMLHMLGYKHSEQAQKAGTDFVYNAEFCCFGDGDGKKQSDPFACQMIAEHPHGAVPSFSSK
ncbi:MAG: hypothetical protein HY074_19400 [Deltaproteobacteria bacterium]|nr:hypothetical protein [Deltaproteobacteria bacterium]